MTIFLKKNILLMSTSLFIIFSLMASGCKQNVNTPKKELVNSASTTNSAIIKGNAILGPVNGATVTVYPISFSGSLDLAHPLATTTTDANGNYSLVVPNKNLSSTPVGVQLTNGSYQEESSGKIISLSRKTLTAVLPSLSPSGQINAAIGPLSEMAFQVFTSNVSNSGIQSISLAQHIKNANDQIAKSFGLTDIVGTIPANPKGKIPNNSNGQYTVVLAAISKAAQNAGTDSIALAAAYSKHLIQYNNLDNVGSTTLSVSNASGEIVSVTPPTVQIFSTMVTQIGNGTLPIAGMLTDPNLIPPVINSAPVALPAKPTSQNCIVANGSGSQTWNGTSYGNCIVNTCNTNYSNINNSCVSNSRACSVVNGTGSQNWGGDAWGICSVNSCNPNYIKTNNACVPSSQACSIASGTGSQTWNGSSWGACTINTCGTNYTKINNVCVPNSQACSIAYGSGSQTWNGSSFGTCNVVTCNPNFTKNNNTCMANSQACSITYGSGSQTWNGPAWGVCSVVSCNTNYTKDNNSCVPNAQACSIANGTGTQTRNGSVLGNCTVSSCNANYSQSGNACVKSSQSCSIANGKGSQTWNGTSLGSCNVISCNDNFEISNNTCVAQKAIKETLTPTATAAGVCDVGDIASLNDCIGKLSSIDTINFTTDVSCSGVGCCGRSGGALIALNGFYNKTIQGNNHHLYRHGSQKLCSAIQIINSSKISIVGLAIDEDAAVAGCAPTDNCADSIAVNGSKQVNFESFGLYNAKAFGIGVNNVNGMVFNNSTVSNTGIIGFYAGDNSSKIAITNSTFSGTRTNAIAFQGVFGSAPGDNLIQNNQIIDNHYQGQWLSPDGGRINGGQIYIPNASYVTVAGNTVTGGNCADCYDTRVWGIELGKESTPGSAGDVSHLTVTQNNFSIKNGCAIFLNQGGSIDASSLVSANTVYGSQTFTCAQVNGAIYAQAFPATNLGQNTFNSTASLPSSTVIGYIDVAVTDSSGQTNLSGWACYQKSNQPISVDLYVGAPFGSAGSISIGRFQANVKSEVAIATSCGASGTNYRFLITLSAAQTSSYANKSIYVYGIAPAGGNNNMLSNSGVLKVSSSTTSVTPPTTPTPPPVQPVVVVVPVAVAGPVTGNVDGLVKVSSDQYVISGWACVQNSSQSISVDLYIGSPYGSSDAIGIGRFVANQASESAVASSCKSSGSAYRFQIPVSASQFSNYSSKLIYVYGIAPSGNNNLLLSNSGVFKIPSFEIVTPYVYDPPVAPVIPSAPVTVAGPVIGYIDGVYLDYTGRSVISGWVCAQNSAAPITIHLYANGSYPIGKIINTYTANVSSEAGLAGVCHSTGTNYRFQIPVTPEMSSVYRGQTIYIHGISPNGGENPVIPGSGNFRIP
ncbi:MAG: right-handed parallel beta-helix repeat-containing protein [Bacteriovorax sp.]|nr:right-handed parallel beta-helix repeat-containing protein [Bacteriovorax sp.]